MHALHHILISKKGRNNIAVKCFFFNYFAVSGNGTTALAKACNVRKDNLQRIQRYFNTTLTSDNVSISYQMKRDEMFTYTFEEDYIVNK